MTDNAPALAVPRPAESAGRRVDLTVVPPPEPTGAPELPPLRLLPAPVSEPPYDDEPVRVPALRLVPAARVGRPRAANAPAAAPRSRTVGDDLPDSRPFAIALVRRLVEVRAGVRPVLQLRPDTTPGLFADLEHALHRRDRTGGIRAGGDVRSVHVQERADGVAEVCATVSRGTRIGALALRLEGVSGRWLCTQVQGL